MDFQTVSGFLKRHYTIGSLSRMEPIPTGTINQCYHLITKPDDRNWILRCYHPATSLSRIQFEHELITTLIQRGFKYCPTIANTNSGDTIARLVAEDTGAVQGPFVAVFEYVHGECDYDWHRPNCSIEHLKSAARILALYHLKINGWHGFRKWRLIPQTTKGIQLLDKWRCGAEPWNAISHLTSSHWDCRMMDATTNRILDLMATADDGQLPRLIIHGDFHPGNLRFQGDQAVGLIDFDWAGPDVRCYDLAMALLYFGVPWAGPENGSWDHFRGGLFIETYDNTLKDHGDLSGLTPVERQWLPPLMGLANLFVMDWILENLTGNPDMDKELISALDHCVRFHRYLHGHQRQLERACFGDGYP